MSYTTLAAIREGLEDVVVGLTPALPHLKRSKYKAGSYNTPWEDKAETDIDREFEIPEVRISDPTMFGTVTEVHYAGEFTLVIGHSKTGDIRKAVDRRDTDIRQIISALSKVANYPSEVSYIWYTGQSISEIRGLFWLTTITFDIYFALVAP